MSWNSYRRLLQESDKRFSGRTYICQLIRKMECMSSLPLKELLFLRALRREHNMPLTIRSSVSEAVVFWVVRVQDLLCLTIICSLLLSRIDFQITNHQASIKPNVKINDPLSLQACRWPCRGEWGIAEKDMLEEQTRAALFTHFSLPSALTTPIGH